MRKKQVHKGLRIGLLIFFLVSIIIPSYLLYQELTREKYEEQKLVHYKYTNGANAKYTVFLTPNILYNETSLGQDNVYVTEFTDYILSSFEYKFTGDSIADIKGDYEIIAIMEGYFAQEQGKTRTMWRKPFVMVPKTAFAANDKSLTVTRDVPIGFQEYNKLAQDIVEQSKFKPDIKMSVLMNVNLQANTGRGIIDEKTSSGIVFPLTESYFEIIKNIKEVKPQTLEEIKVIPFR